MEQPTVYTTRARGDSPARYYIRIRVDSKPRRHYLGVVGELSKRDLNKAVEKVLEDATDRQGKQNVAVVRREGCSPKSFQAFVEQYQEDKFPDLSESTREAYKHVIREQILPFFRDITLSTIDDTHVRKWVAWMKTKRGLALSTRRTAKNILSNILSYAELRKLGRNPCSHVRAGSRDEEATIHEPRLLSSEEFHNFLTALPEDIRLMAELASSTGLRMGEVLGLRWKDVDLKTGWVKPSGRVYKGKFMERTKTRSSRRARFLGDLLPKFRELRKQHENATYVFEREGTFDKYNRVAWNLSRAAKAVGIYEPGFGSHYFRRQYVTLMPSMGATDMEISRFVGHSSVAMTQKYHMRHEERLEELTRKMQKNLRLTQDDTAGSVSSEA
jgi:integrase